MLPGPSRPKVRTPLYFSSHNLAAFRRLFNWLSVGEINRLTVLSMTEHLGVPLSTKDFRVEMRWKLYDQYYVFDKQDQALFHIKRSWEENFLREALGLHLATHVFDPDLFVPNYLTGTYLAGMWRWKSPVPYIMTQFVHGKEVRLAAKREDSDPMWFWFGRQYYVHRLLSLYDVEPRHFLMAQNGALKRLDLGLVLTKLNEEYNGFWGHFGENGVLEEKSSFQEGVMFEQNQVQHNLVTTRQALGVTLREFKSLEEDSIVDFNPDKFIQDLLCYWDNWVPELQLGRMELS